MLKNESSAKKNIPLLILSGSPALNHDIVPETAGVQGRLRDLLTGLMSSCTVGPC